MLIVIKERIFIVLLSTFFLTVVFYSSVLAQSSNSDLKLKSLSMKSKWGKKVADSTACNTYPRPGLVRSKWQNLNGSWDYCISDTSTNYFKYSMGKILVPFPIESELSTVKRTLSPNDILWYRRYFKKPVLSRKSDKVILHFGAVDWDATVFINGKEVARHKGGYTSFSVDVTNQLEENENELVVKVFDPSDRGINPHGKQVLNPENIYYTPSSGIWQTVWLEEVAAQYISDLKVTPDIDGNRVRIKTLVNNKDKNQVVKVEVLKGGIVVAQGEGNAEGLIDIKIDKPHLWCPEDPFLYKTKVKLIDRGKVIDEVTSYFGMRKISVGKLPDGSSRIFLNNKYYFNLGVLDQGFWPDGLLTPPNAQAMIFDIKAIKTLGFNTIRKHIKVEPEQWYYYADSIGVLVWQDFVNPPPTLPPGSRPEFEKELKETLAQLYNHPSIVTWVLFNERWGAYDQERLTKWVKELDPTRLVNGHTGELLYVRNKLRLPSKDPWVASDMADIHTYPFPMGVPQDGGKIKVIGEFGGINVSVPYHEWNDLKTWGYASKKPRELPLIYDSMMTVLKKLEGEGISASIYTQPFDVETEENGVITYDREIVKIDPKLIRKSNAKLWKFADNDKVNPIFNIGPLMDLDDTDDKYSDYLNDFNNGKRDSAFVRRLVLMAMREKDTPNVELVSGYFIKSISDPFSYSNLKFIQNCTINSKSSGFIFLTQNKAHVEQVLDSGSITEVLKSVIRGEYITPYVSIPSSKVDWQKITREVQQKYGDEYSEYVWGTVMVYNLDHKNWKDFAQGYVNYYKTAKTHSVYHINNITWSVFEQVSDAAVLKFAAEVMKYNIENKDSSSDSIDTYANLLYKSGNKEEAIKWERKAVEGSNGNKEISENLRKMESGLPTWPTPDSTKN
ncbi:MAG: glycoside hydrolase family 2 [Chitinophaga sp.]|uniref:glycoside hydrolase family 2 protein n=1 Tax=Chitinophaga sp. TaxID=1869181 RepID=UPI0025BC45AD|nr:sugar-binding domain-containing protein [Chitinophaga sp.]MBV8253625.1 glycoside hydrolase family 2 [Chitinophaga sp.]